MSMSTLLFTTIVALAAIATVLALAWTLFVAGDVSGDVAVVLELVEIARDGGTRHALAECCDELRRAETTPVFGQRHGDRELDAVHAHADQRVQLDGERGV